MKNFSDFGTGQWNDSMVCPHCNYKSKYVATLKKLKRGTRDGDLTLCSNCGEFIVVSNGTKSLRKLTDSELSDLQHASNWPDLLSKSLPFKAKYMMRN